MLIEDVAIFWDYENVRVAAKGINVPIVEALLEYSKSVGHPRVMKVYSDWAGINKVIIQALYSLGFDPIQVSMGKTNSVDVKMAVDCMDVAQSIPSIRYFIIVTGDKDFISLVNWLKAHRKEVIIISRANLVSEHLLLSASDFISLEELSKMFKSSKFAPPKKSEGKALSFEDGVNCLIDTIQEARDQGKSTRLEIIANLMRSSSKYDYEGTVTKPDDSKLFSSFTKFVDEVERQGKVKTEMNEGFKELFLIDENPEVESEFSSSLLRTIDKPHWERILAIIIGSFEGEVPEKEKEFQGGFMHMFRRIKEAKRRGELPFSNNKLQEALEKVIEFGFLVKQPDNKYRLVENYKSKVSQLIEKLLLKG